MTLTHVFSRFGTVGETDRKEGESGQIKETDSRTESKTAVERLSSGSLNSRLDSEDPSTVVTTQPRSDAKDSRSGGSMPIDQRQNKR